MQTNIDESGIDILVVDDVPNNLEVVMEVLTAAGYSVADLFVF